MNNKINTNNNSTKLKFGILTVSVIAVLIISTSSVIQYVYAIDAPRIIALVASDPDNLDDIYSIDDTITITFDSDTNESGGTGNQQRTAVDDLFTFTESLGDQYRGQWTTPYTFTITIKNVNNAEPPVIDVTTVTPSGTTPILSADGTSNASFDTSPVLFGDFGEPIFLPPWMNGGAGVIYYDGGNVGIGTTNPNQPLSVNGIIESTFEGFMFPDGTTQTTANTGNIEGVTAGTGLSGGGTSGDVTLDVDTSSIQNRVTGSCSVGSSISVINEDGTVTCETDDIGDNPWTPSSSYIYYTDGNVGIGTTSPNTLLHLLSNTEANLTIQSSTGDATLYIDRGATAQDSGIVFSDQGTAKIKIGLTESDDSFKIKNEVSGENLFSVSSGGSLGVLGSITATDFKFQDGSYSRHIFRGGTIETQGNGAHINVVVSMIWASTDLTSWNSEKRMFHYFNNGGTLGLKGSSIIYDTGSDGDIIATVTGSDVTFSFPPETTKHRSLIEVFGIDITGVG